MATKGFTGAAGKRMDALVRELDAEPNKAARIRYETWRETVISRATALFGMVGKKAALDNMKSAQSARLVELLGEVAAVAAAARQSANTTAN